ncbi:alpha/beta hydrolase family protein [Robertkochia solimangrovi]|uniref:S9 family peptidase n=1 Tax=Robertkochia solimangrovi TaxID=2213046 RepID=UPI00118124BA|nr:S9 family peptidase [Robertkochia solimangrovi]TRZ41457.1 S9 family peptidase [Robertkochia solimangrovi]
MKAFLFAALLTLSGLQIFAQELKDPSFEEILSIRNAGSPVISPDGSTIAYTSTTTDWENNKYDTEIWLIRPGESPFQLTNAKDGGSTNPKWSPDGQWIAFSSDRDEKNQIFVIRSAGGEAIQLTGTEGSVSDFDWSPDGKQIAFIQAETESEAEKKRKKKYGDYFTDDEKFYLHKLWIIPFEGSDAQLRPALPKDSAATAALKSRELISESSYSINNFSWSPDSKQIAFEHQPNPLINTFFKADISLLDVASEKITPLINNKSYDGLIGWSPDGNSILYSSSLNDTISNYYKNDKYFIIGKDGSGNRQVGSRFDENLGDIHWTPRGIFATAWQKTQRKLVYMDPASGKVTLIKKGPERIYGISFSKDGSKVAFSGTNDDDITEIYSGDANLTNLNKYTSNSDIIKDWAVSNSEVISWKSKDGAKIEGVLMKPQNFDPDKKYPLLVIIHGGPTGISTPGPVPSYVYPMVQWLNKGALILQPNYRGSAGYGEEFRELNVRNLGVGDAWDVLSGVDYLISKGLVDNEKIGCMGWSQGGYISAFLTTNSDRFKAISVGAGISNWMTYYVNTDIHPFTRQYLKATPWSDKEIYEVTSPMTNINQAKTPTLIQHGEFDRRVPIANAYELLQGLRDVGVPSKLIVYKGFGHGITKPKERLAAMWHNWIWFGKYLWNEEIVLPE